MTTGWQTELDATVHAFRLGMEGAGNDHLQKVIDRLAPELETLSATHQQAMMGWLQQVLEAQQRNDMIRIADLLQYEIAPLVKSLT